MKASNWGDFFFKKWTQFGADDWKHHYSPMTYIFLIVKDMNDNYWVNHSTVQNY